MIKEIWYKIWEFIRLQVSPLYKIWYYKLIMLTCVIKNNLNKYTKVDSINLNKIRLYIM